MLDPVRRKKLWILWLGVLLYFLSTMSKVLIPASIMEELLGLKTLSVVQISLLGGGFWYAYAVSQLLSGIFSDRYGGVRALLTGGTVFAAGVLLFPATKYFPLMFLCRILAGLGAGGVFLGVAKLLADLFSEKFSLFMGIVLFIGFLGIPCGTSPMTALVGVAGWRWAMVMPGILAAALLSMIALLAKGTIQPVKEGNALLPLWNMLKNGPVIRVCLSFSLLCVIYSLVLTLIGQKSLCDTCHLERISAARLMLLLTVFVAVTNMGCSGVLKLFGNRRKAAAFVSAFCALTGTVAGFFAFAAGGSLLWVLPAYFILAVPGGFFPLFSTICKELNPPENAGLSVALLNFTAAIVIAILQNLGGALLGCYPMTSQMFPLAAYRMFFLLLIPVAVAGTLLLVFVPETAKLQQKGR